MKSLDNVKVTLLEAKVLQSLFASAKGNGHDFGFIEDSRSVVSTPLQLGGVVSSLVKKGLIVVHAPVTNDSGTFTQFTWGIDLKNIETLLKGAALNVLDAMRLAIGSHKTFRDLAGAETFKPLRDAYLHNAAAYLKEAKRLRALIGVEEPTVLTSVTHSRTGKRRLKMPSVKVRISHDDAKYLLKKIGKENETLTEKLERGIERYALKVTAQTEAAAVKADKKTAKEKVKKEAEAAASKSHKALSKKAQARKKGQKVAVDEDDDDAPSAGADMVEVARSLVNALKAKSR